MCIQKWSIDAPKETQVTKYTLVLVGFVKSYNLCHALLACIRSIILNF